MGDLVVFIDDDNSNIVHTTDVTCVVNIVYLQTTVCPAKTNNWQMMLDCMAKLLEAFHIVVCGIICDERY